MLNKIEYKFINEEWKNYFVTRPLFFGHIRMLNQILNTGARRLGYKVLKKEVLPTYLSESDITAALKRNTQLEIFIPDIQGINGNSQSSVFAWANQYRQTYEAFLAGTYKLIKDPEEYWTLHQFGWLFALLITDKSILDATSVIKYISSWIERLGESNNDPSWRSYSISERLCNWFNIFQLLDLKSWVPKIMESIWLQIRHLVKHLEEYPNGNTNNHLINNGRALYIIGKALGHKGLSYLGRTILINETNRQITTEGFLDEGSSHYQLLATKNYLEVLRTAYLTSDLEFIKILFPIVNAMLKACAFFSDSLAPEEWQILYIGNISPDFPPQLFNKNTHFWDYVKEALINFGKEDTEINFSIPWYASQSSSSSELPAQNKGWLCYPESGYYRWNGENYCLWWHVRRSCAPRRHSHNDWGSFQMHVHGEPIFVDPGRQSYCETNTTYDGRLTLAQNSLSVDGLEQSIFYQRDLFDPDYLTDGAKVELSGDDNEGVIFIDILGYKRLYNPVTHRRAFYLKPETVIIEDSLNGNGIHTVVLAFHLHPGIKYTRDSDNVFSFITMKGQRMQFILASGGIVKVKRGGLHNFPGGYCTTVYGTKQETTSIFAQYRGLISMKLQHILKVF